MLNSLPLSKIKVLDLTHVIAGPYCTRLLAGFGAEVIKVEKTGGGDMCRRLPPFFNDEPDSEKSLPFLYLNAGKKSITLNLKTVTGQGIFKKLAKEAEMCFLPLSFVTDYDCWHEEAESVSVELLINNLKKNVEHAEQLIVSIVESIKDKQIKCDCTSSLENAIITNPDLISQETKKKLSPLIGKYFPGIENL